MTETFDAIVLGVGAMGSAVCWRLAERGLSVLGLEQHAIGHALGSSHGETRLIRRAYFEHPAYVPLLERAYELWRDLEGAVARPLFHQNGVVIFGPRDGAIMAGVRRSSAEHAIPVRSLNAADSAYAFDGFRPPSGYEALLEPGAGYLEVEACVRAQAAAARQLGADLREGQPALSVDRGSSHVTVKTAAGVYQTSRLVVTAGPWSRAFVPDVVSAHLTVHRVPLVWFAGDARYDVAAGLPCFGFELPSGFYYGVPAVGPHGVKVGLHKPGTRLDDPARLDRTLRDSDVEPLVAFVKACLPGVDPTPRHHAICMYTMTPDEHFVLDTDGQTTYAAGFSGHGFKFAPVIGEILADLAVEGHSRHPVDFLRSRWT